MLLASPSVALTLISATVGLHLEQVVDLPLARALELAGQLSDAIEARTGARAVVDDPVWSTCKSDDRCLGQIRARTGAETILLLRLVGGVQRVRLVVERFPELEVLEPRVEQDVSLDPTAADAELRVLAARLFAEGIAARPPAVETAPPVELPPDEPPSLLPTWLCVGASAALLGAGVAFGASSASARSDSQDPLLDDPGFEALADRTQRHAWVANVLYVAAGVSLAAGTALLLLQ